jgi:hypothetical protein
MHGFYAERDRVLGCERIADVAQADAARDVVWGNADGVATALGPSDEMRSLAEWRASST